LDFLVASGSRADAAGVPDVWIGDYAPGVPGFFGGVSRVRHQAIDCPVGSASANCPASGTAGAGGYTYGDLGKVGVVNGVHDGGEIWSQTMWDLRETLGRTNALKIITGGMRLSPNNPSMLDMRNSILQSATVNGIDTSAVWSVFAARGMGYRASTANANANSATEDFTVPPALEATTVTVDDNSPRGDGDGVAEPGETLAMKVTLKNNLSGPSTPLTAALTVSDGLVTQGSSKWPALTAGASAMGTPAMALTLPETIQCGTGITLSVTANSPDGTVDIPNRQIVLGKPSFANSADIPKVIPDGNVGGVNSTFTLPGSGTIQNLSVRLGQINHTWVGDLKITLSHAGTTVTLVNRIGEGGSGSSSDNIVNMILDDGAAGPVDRAPYTAGGFTGSFRPEEPLSAFNGHSFSGVWTLNVADLNPSDTGTLQQWGLGPRVCDTFGLPTSVTNAASAVGVNAATLNGAHNSGGNATDYRFEWGTSTGYGQTTALTAGGSSASAVPVSAALTGLAPSTTYHYRLVALRDGFVLSRGADQVFTTAAPPPVVVPDTTAPVVKVTKAPKKKMKTKRAKVRVAVRFSSEPGAAFTCKLNKAAAKACTSPFKAKVAAKPGKGKKHAIVIVARDAAGNTSTPAAVRFTVVRRR
jgi:subtilisin-like proprotein convertase family protein